MIEISPILNQKRIVKYSLIFGVFITISIVGGYFLPEGIDWSNTYRPAAIAILDGKSPYTIDIYFAAPWAAFLLIPFAVMPVWMGRGFIFVTGLVVFAILAKRLGARPIALSAFLLSPPVWHCLLNSNIEWMALIGYVLPPQIGLILVAIKPQIGLGAAIFWFFESWRKGGLREVVKVFAFPSLLLGVSFLMFGLWPLRFSDTMTMTQEYNQSLFPASIPVGLALLAYAIKKYNIRPAMAAAPCLSPYVLLHAWTGALAAVVTDDLVTVMAVIGLWILMALRLLGT